MYRSCILSNSLLPELLAGFAVKNENKRHYINYKYYTYWHLFIFVQLRLRKKLIEVHARGAMILSQYKM